MIKTSTPNDVIRYVYGEILSDIEKKKIENSILNNSELSDLYFETLSLMKALNKAKKEPSRRSIENILLYSKNFKLHTVTK